MSPDTSHVGTGLALAVYEARKARLVAKGNAWSQLAQAARYEALDGLADDSSDIAAAVVAHIQANALVTVAAGIPVATSGTPTAQTGATNAPGTGTVS